MGLSETTTPERLSTMQHETRSPATHGVVVKILIGAPGAGKTTYAKSLAALLSRSVMVFSADDHFVGDDGVYRFDVSKLGDAHAGCMRRFASTLALLSHHATVFDYCLVVDNTNTTLVEISPYYLLARAYGAPVELVVFDVDAETAAARNVHGVPPEGVRAASARVAALEIPPYWEASITRIGGQ